MTSEKLINESTRRTWTSADGTWTVQSAAGTCGDVVGIAFVCSRVAEAWVAIDGAGVEWNGDVHKVPKYVKAKTFEMCAVALALCATEQTVAFTDERVDLARWITVHRKDFTPEMRATTARDIRDWLQREPNASRANVWSRTADALDTN